MALKLILDIGKEKGLVFLDRSADRAAELIEVELFGIRGEKATRVEFSIAEEFEEAAVNGIGAVLGGDQHCRTGASAPFGRVIIGENFEFLDGVDGRKN